MYYSRKVSQNLTDLMIETEIAEPAKRDVLIYCFEYFFDQILYISIFLLLGLIINQFKIAVLFLLMFYTLRSFGGGYHASTEKICTHLSFAIYLSVLFTAPTLTYQHSTLWFIMFILSIIVIIYFAPVESPNKPLSQEQKKKMKKNCIFYCSIIVSLFIILYMNDLKLYYGTMSMCAILIACSMLLGIITNKSPHKK